MDENFLLHSELAEKLYHEFAQDLPIIDYHCHLDPKEIYQNRSYKTITEVWLYGDHYKWRAMRTVGIDEHYITGDASDYEKFLAWAKTVPKLIGNPLYHWTHMELQFFFEIFELLDEETAPIIWEKANERLVSGELNVRDLISRANVEVICTTDDPTDSLVYHQKIANDTTFNVKVLPSFRPDKGLDPHSPTFLTWLEKLSDVSHRAIHSYQDLLSAFEQRIEFFHQIGGRISDHALDHFMFIATTLSEVEEIFARILAGEQISETEAIKYKSYTLTFLAKQYAKRNWAMQLHLNALRNNNTRMLNTLGPDTGYDAMNDHLVAQPLVSFFDQLEKEQALPRTIVYSLNPNDNAKLATIIGSFQGNGIPGKMQLGTAWWFNDTKRGMLDQMENLANIGVLSSFIGMLTDSRSFLSYPRHDYFRRIVCNLIADWVEAGEYPKQIDRLGDIIQGISYQNARTYFKF